MNARPLELEDFNLFVDTAVAPVEAFDGERLEAEKLESFDKGYTAGWDDATEAVQRDTESRSQVFDTRLEELSFTFHEARAHVMRGLSPLIEAIVKTALPRLLHETLGPRLIEAFEDMAGDLSNPEIRVLTAKGEAAEVMRALGDKPRFPVEVLEEENLPEGVLQVRLGDKGREIDLGAMEQVLTDALFALDTHNEELLSHG
ncbi:hypothetical protein [Palleronia abyssalis]|uniref:Flagellar assembly protein FliH/Type III secretion system HrpE domain-containing protein n=1 Tax=Palleronia abyssalis TaxID=1501240 RepID=A0A2R8BWX5_9RHOB|nr:hypothetical protein [Palleronia abyssalis]SPJ24655.1 hypothetical protein PAA8504_02492 [Palleronia abyssalis]